MKIKHSIQSTLNRTSKLLANNEEQLFLIVLAVIVAVFFRGYMDYGLHFDKVNRLNTIIHLINPKAYPDNQSIFNITIFGHQIPIMYKQYISSVSGLSSIYLPLYFFENYYVGLKFLDFTYFVLTIFLSYKLVRKYTDLAFVFGLMLLVSPILYPKILFGFVNNIHIILFLFASHLLYLYYSNKNPNKWLLFAGFFILFFSCNLFFYNSWILAGLLATILLFFPGRVKRTLLNIKELSIILIAFFIGLFNYIVYNVAMGFPSASLFFMRLFSRDEYNLHPIDAVQAKPFSEDIAYKFNTVIPHLLGKHYHIYYYSFMALILAYLIVLFVLIKQKVLKKYRFYFIPIFGFFVTFVLILLSPKTFRAGHYLHLSPFLELSIISIVILYMKVFTLKWIKPVLVTILILLISLNISSSYGKIKKSRLNKGRRVFSPAIYDLNNYLDLNNIDFNSVFFSEWGLSAQIYFLNKGEKIINDYTGEFRYKHDPELSESLERNIISFINDRPGIKEIFFPVLSYKDLYVLDGLLKVVKNLGFKAERFKTFYQNDGSEIIYLYRVTGINQNNIDWAKQIVQRTKKRLKNKPSDLKSYVDYKQSDYPWTLGIYPREKEFCWFSQNAKILLISEKKNEFFISCFIPDINKYPKVPHLSIYIGNEMVFSDEIKKSGDFKKTIKIPIRYKIQKTVVVRINLSQHLMAPEDSRNLGIPVREIGFK